MPADDQHDRSTIGGVPGGQASSGPHDPASVAAQLQQVDDVLAQLDELPVDAQVAVFTGLHQQLTSALAVTSTAAGPSDQPSGHRPGLARPNR